MHSTTATTAPCCVAAAAAHQQAAVTQRASQSAGTCSPQTPAERTSYYMLPSAAHLSGQTLCSFVQARPRKGAVQGGAEAQLQLRVGVAEHDLVRQLVGINAGRQLLQTVSCIILVNQGPPQLPADSPEHSTAHTTQLLQTAARAAPHSLLRPHLASVDLPTPGCPLNRTSTSGLMS